MAAGRVDGLGRVDGQTLVLGELTGVAVTHRTLVGAGGDHVGPRGRRGLHDVLAVVEHPAVGRSGRREQLAVVGGGVDGGLQQAVGRQGVVALERDDPPLRRELGGPDDVDGDHVVVRVLGLEVLDEVVVLGVGLVRLLPDGDLLVGVVLVPHLGQRLEVAVVVLALDEGDRALGVARLRLAAAAATAAAGGEHAGCEGAQRDRAGNPRDASRVEPGPSRAGGRAHTWSSPSSSCVPRRCGMCMATGTAYSNVVTQSLARDERKGPPCADAQLLPAGCESVLTLHRACRHVVREALCGTGTGGRRLPVDRP